MNSLLYYIMLTLAVICSGMYVISVFSGEMNLSFAFGAVLMSVVTMNVNKDIKNGVDPLL